MIQNLTQSLWLLQLLIGVMYFSWLCKEPYRLEASSALSDEIKGTSPLQPAPFHLKLSLEYQSLSFVCSC
jgi:hypothetical protein